MRVLIVDDDFDIREVTRFWLEEIGYTVAEAWDGIMALEYLRYHLEPHVVLLDYMMPRLDGGQLLQVVAEEQGRLAAHTYLLLTASDRTVSATLQALLARLHVPWLSKPFDWGELEEMVARLATRLRA
jgi:two-component system alkaline phosphatase synthesis response regulator PhoP